MAELSDFIPTGVVIPPTPINPTNWASVSTSRRSDGSVNGGGYSINLSTTSRQGTTNLALISVSSNLNARSQRTGYTGTGGFTTEVNETGKGWLLAATILNNDAGTIQSLRITIDGVAKTFSRVGGDFGLAASYVGVETTSGQIRPVHGKPLSFVINASLSDEERSWCLGVIGTYAFQFDSSLLVEVNNATTTGNAFYCDYVFESEILG